MSTRCGLCADICVCACRSLLESRMRYLRLSGLMSGDGKRANAKRSRTAPILASTTSPVLWFLEILTDPGPMEGLCHREAGEAIREPDFC